MELLAQDLRCLDAHAHLGNFEFERRPDQALRHYEMGLSIGGERLGKTREATALFRKMLTLNPSDNQGARFNLAAVEAGKTWTFDGVCSEFHSGEASEDFEVSRVGA